jgi:hypothetical protein
MSLGCSPTRTCLDRSPLHLTCNPQAAQKSMDNPASTSCNELLDRVPGPLISLGTHVWMGLDRNIWEISVLRKDINTESSRKGKGEETCFITWQNCPRNQKNGSKGGYGVKIKLGHDLVSRSSTIVCLWLCFSVEK